MSQVDSDTLHDEMKDEYDIRGGVRGKYFERHQSGTNVVLLERDVATVFPDSESVNRVLRMLIEMARHEVITVNEKQDP